MELGSLKPVLSSLVMPLVFLPLLGLMGLVLIAMRKRSGWAAGTGVNSSEAEVAARVALQDYGFNLRWAENQSRDTAENAQMIAPLLKRDGITRVALVTDALRMPRAMVEFKRTGLAITPAPMGYVLPTKSDLLQWLPTTDGLAASTRLIHEQLGLVAVRLQQNLV
jgi:uncharacterized SAM-binding protein YcdF (DUF218 family)